MITAGQAIVEVKKVTAICDDAEAYSILNEVIEELYNTGLWNPLVGYMDICTDQSEITLPDDVEIPLAINVGGIPAEFRNKWFEFHLNGPGSECHDACCSWSWTDKGRFPTFRSIKQPSTVVAYPQAVEAAGTQIRVYGYKIDANGNQEWVMTPDSNGNLIDGCAVSVIYGTPVNSSVTFARITRVTKPVTNSFVQLQANDPGSTTGITLLGLFRPGETEPSFRRITVSGAGCNRLNQSGSTGGCNSSSCNPCCTNPTTTWVRMRFRMKGMVVAQSSDPIFLDSMTAIKQMAMAVRKYQNDLLDEYGKYFQSAKAALERKQKASNGPNQVKIQFQRNWAGSRSQNLI